VGHIVGLKDIELVMELEDEFDIGLPNGAYFLFGTGVKSDEGPPPMDPTVGEIHSRLCAVIAERGRPVPADSWHRVRKRIMKIFDVKAEEVRPDTRLYTDLGANR
jgi:acyl carrier protein